MVALREWGAWALLAPWALHAFHERMAIREVLLRCALFGSLAASAPIAADLISGDRSLGSSFFLFWPRNLALAAALSFVARALSRPVPPAATAVVPASLDEPPATLLVSKGADQCLIRVEDIQHLSASGNYVDICAANHRYLLRATIGDLEAKLPRQHFVRIHRSHMVRVREIERIRIERSGSGTVLLRGGVALPISRTYRAQLKAQQALSIPRMH
jgi:DNA-binding LytR/AlgR family response regulator